MSLIRSVYLHDGEGNPISSLNGALDIHDSHVHTAPVNQYLHRHKIVTTTLSTAIVSGDYVINVVSSVGMNIGDKIQIANGAEESTFPEITLIVGNALTLDRPIDFAFSIGDTVDVVEIDMNEIATQASPYSYKVAPSVGVVWHLQRILLSMTHSTAGDLGLFGNQTRLTNGVVLRANISGQNYTFTTWHKNADIKDDMYDVEFDVRSGGGGTYGTTGRGSFNKIGVTVRLDGTAGDYLEVLTQDDLSGLLTFRIKAQGHIEGV